MRRAGSFLLTVLALGAVPGQASGQALELDVRTVALGGQDIVAATGLLSLPQKHESPEAGSLRIAVLVLKTPAAEPEPPLFFLIGIPSSATAMGDAEMWAPYLASSDVVLIDQRGTGRSEPRLIWDQAPLRAEKLFGGAEAATAHAIETAEVVRHFAEQRGVHLGAFNTKESARDIEAVRAALGYETIRLVAHSGGTHLAFEYLRQHAERVTHFACLGTAGLHEIHALPGRLDEALRHVSALAAADPRIGEAMPEMYDRLVSMVQSLEQQPLEFALQHPGSGQAVTLQLGPHGLLFILLFDLADPADFIVFPRMVHEWEQGKTDTLAWFVRKRYRQMSRWPAVVFINRGASGATAERWTEIRSQAETSLFGMTRCFFSPELDAAFGIDDLGDAFRAPARCTVPTLFVSGSLDANTPPAQAEAARSQFPDSRHLILENGGHDSILDRPEVHEAIRAFFDGQKLADSRVELPVPRFALLEGPDELVSHPSLR
jgi:pimeloyl-ACP methyl ester carboxylesterase